MRNQQTSDPATDPFFEQGLVEFPFEIHLSLEGAIQSVKHLMDLISAHELKELLMRAIAQMNSGDPVYSDCPEAYHRDMANMILLTNAMDLFSSIADPSAAA